MDWLLSEQALYGMVAVGLLMGLCAFLHNNLPDDAPVKRYVAYAMVATGCVFFPTVILSGVLYRRDLAQHVRYTLGTTLGGQLTRGTGIHVRYRYTVNGRWFEESDRKRDAPLMPGARYFVRFSSRHPDHADLLQTCPVPDSIHQAPAAGWATIPIPCNDVFMNK